MNGRRKIAPAAVFIQFLAAGGTSSCGGRRRSYIRRWRVCRRKCHAMKRRMHRLPCISHPERSRKGKRGGGLQDSWNFDNLLGMEHFFAPLHTIERGNKFFGIAQQRGRQPRRRQAPRQSVRRCFYLSGGASAGDRRAGRKGVPVGQSGTVYRASLRQKDRDRRGARRSALCAQARKTREMGERFPRVCAVRAMRSERSPRLWGVRVNGRITPVS